MGSNQQALDAQRGKGALSLQLLLHSFSFPNWREGGGTDGV